MTAPDKAASQRCVFRYEVPVDDRWHDLPLSGDIVHVACRDRPDVVEVWAISCYPGPYPRRFIVVGTGHPWPDGPLVHRGTALAAGGQLVWHLLEEVPF